MVTDLQYKTQTPFNQYYSLCYTLWIEWSLIFLASTLKLHQGAGMGLMRGSDRFYFTSQMMTQMNYEISLRQKYLSSLNCNRIRLWPTFVNGSRGSCYRTVTGGYKMTFCLNFKLKQRQKVAFNLNAILLLLSIK